MEDNSIKVSFGVSTDLALKIEALEKEYSGEYKLLEDKMNRLLEIYNSIKILALRDEGDVIEVLITADRHRASIIAEVPVIGAYKERMSEFSYLLGITDFFDVKTGEDEVLIVEVGVNNLWEKV